MSEVNIYKDDKNTWHCEVNGVDLAPVIKDGALHVEFPAGNSSAVVYMALVPRKLRMRLPEATIRAVDDILPGGDA